jgi:uroporphyrinogen-III synthase
MRILITRPEPAASRTAAKLATLGHEALVVPLMTARPLDWTPPTEVADAIAFTSALALEHGGPELQAFHHLPAYAVGEATAAAARAAGFRDVRAGSADAAVLFATAAGDGIRTLLHLAGRDRIATAPAGLIVIVRELYAVDPVDAVPPAADIALVYSARAAAQLATIVGAAKSGLSVAALSPAVAAALGSGWHRVMVAATPDEEALFAAAFAWGFAAGGPTCEKPG